MSNYVIFFFLITLLNPINPDNIYSAHSLLTNSTSEIYKILNDSISNLGEEEKSNLDVCQEALNSLSYKQLLDLFENSGKGPSDIGKYAECIASNNSYYLINNHYKILDNSSNVIHYLQKNFSNYGLCAPIECNNTVFDYFTSKSYLSSFGLINSTIYASYPNDVNTNSENTAKKSFFSFYQSFTENLSNNNLSSEEIIAIILYIALGLLLLIKIVVPIVMGTCCLKHSYLKYTKNNNYNPGEDKEENDDEELNNEDDDDDDKNLFKNNLIDEGIPKDKLIRSIIFKKHLQSFFSFNLNFSLLIKNKNFLYNDNYLQPISLLKSMTLLFIFYNESFNTLIKLPIKNNEDEKFFLRKSMIFVKYTTLCMNIYVMLEGFLYSYKLLYYIKTHYNPRKLALTFFLFYTKTIPKMLTCIISFFIFNVGIQLITEKKLFNFSPFVQYFESNYNKRCLASLSYIFLPFKLHYCKNTMHPTRYFDICFKYIYININIQICITFLTIIIYFMFKFKNNLFDIVILIIFGVNTVFSPLTCRHLRTNAKMNITIFAGEVCTLKYPHLFINGFFFGAMGGVIYFYFIDILSESPLQRLFYKEKYTPFYYCLYLMKTLDTFGGNIKTIFILACISMQIFISSIFVIYEESMSSLIFNVARNDWGIIENYEKKLFLFFFMVMTLMFLFLNKTANSSFYKWVICKLISRTSFGIFCSMEVVISFIYSTYQLRIFLNFHNTFYMCISLFVICLAISSLFTILTEQSFKIICKNTFGYIQLVEDTKNRNIQENMLNIKEKKGESFSYSQKSFELK